MEPKNYGYNLSLYKETDEELIQKGNKYRKIGLIMFILSIPLFIYGGFILTIIGLVLMSKKKFYNKIIAQRIYFAEIQKMLDDILKIEITPDTSADNSPRRSLSELPLYDFEPLRKNISVKKIFPLVVIDVETTGLNRGSDKIIEVTAIKYENNFQPTSCFTTLINPEKPISPEATAINNITDDMVKDSPCFRHIREQLQEYISGCNIAGYNTRFDMEFLYKSGIDFNSDIHYFDLCDISRKMIKKSDVENHKLSTVCSKLGVDTVQTHRSLSDAYATGQLFELFYNMKNN